MAQAPIIFGPNQESDSEIGGASPLAMNVIIDRKGAVSRRPGIATYSEAPTTVVDANGIDGLHATADGDLVAVGGATPARTIYVIGGGAATAFSGTTSTLYGNTRPTFAENERNVFIAGGQDMQRLDIAALTSARLGGSPPYATHIAGLAQRLLSNDLTSTTSLDWVRYSGLGLTGSATWQARRYFSAEGRPDPVKAIAENSNELFVFGSTTLQVFAPDASVIFAPGRTMNLGCSAPYSMVRIDESFAWLDDRRRFVLSDGRGRQDISGAIAATLDEIATVNDCFGYRVDMGQSDVLAWTFPSDGRSFAWHRDAGWSQWAGWNDSTGQPTQMPVSAHCTTRDGVHVVGTGDGYIGKFSMSTHTDLGDTIKAHVRTGFQSHGTDARKHCKSMRLTLKRGQASTAPTGLLSWRDDLGAFCSPIAIDFGATGDVELTVELRSLGVYRRRQWQFEFTDAVELSLVSAFEEYDVLSN